MVSWAIPSKRRTNRWTRWSLQKEPDENGHEDDPVGESAIIVDGGW